MRKGPRHLDLQLRVDAALGKRPCDLLFKDVQFLDVFSCQMQRGDVAIADGAVVGVDPGLRATRTIDGRGKWLVPGFIDAHVHVESSLLVPSQFEQAVLPRGTTRAICDPHELANVQGVKGIQYFLDEATRMRLDLHVMLSSCVPATHMETNGGGVLRASDLTPLVDHPRALGLAEMMNVPGVLGGDPDIHQKLHAFAHRPLDGHAPLLRGRELSAYASTGISSCHESSELEEAREKLLKGISVWIREGSVAKDLDALIPLLTLASSTSLGFCTDDRNPLDIQEEGHVDHLVRQAIKKGVPAPVALRAASWSVARHYGLDRGPARVGAIAPGYAADVILLDSLDALAIADVYKGGVPTSELAFAPALAVLPENSVHASVPEAKDLEGPSGSVHVIGVQHGRILTDRAVLAHDAPGVARLSVLERHGKNSKPANAYVTGFGPLRGAIASSVGHDSHNLIVVGSNTQDMRTALAALIQSGGGFCVSQEGTILEHLALPLGGLMSTAPHSEIARRLKRLKEAASSIGCALPEPFLQLAFLSLPVIPSLKLTDKGLVDVDRFEVISVRAS